MNSRDAAVVAVATALRVNQSEDGHLRKPKSLFNSMLSCPAASGERLVELAWSVERKTRAVMQQHRARLSSIVVPAIWRGTKP